MTGTSSKYFASKGKAIAAVSSSKRFLSHILWSSKSLGLMKLDLQYHIWVSYWENYLEYRLLFAYIHHTTFLISKEGTGGGGGGISPNFHCLIGHGSAYLVL